MVHQIGQMDGRSLLQSTKHIDHIGFISFKRSHKSSACCFGTVELLINIAQIRFYHMVRQIIAVVSLLVTGMFQACIQQDRDYNPTTYLDSVEQEAFKFRIARYIVPLPKNASYETRFDTVFDNYYMRSAERHRLDAYYRAPDSFHYFLVTKVAPSLSNKRVAIGGRLRYAADGTSIEYYEEVFRTWKMKENTLQEKSMLLFDKMILRQDLSRYYTENSPKEEYIEFPDRNTRYNVELRQWELIADTASAK